MRLRTSALMQLFLVSTYTLAFGQSPPKRSTVYQGTSTQKVEFASAVYATNRSMTAEAWVFREDDTRCETIVSQNYTRSFWFGFCDGKLRFYRSGAASADADAGGPKHR